LSSLSSEVLKDKSSAIGLAVSKANNGLASKIGSCMIHVYNDAKKLTLSGYSFVGRVVVSKYYLETTGIIITINNKIFIF